MQTVFFPLSAYPQGVPASERYKVSIDKKSMVLLDVTLINSPREVHEEEESETLLGWEADMDYMSCAEPASKEIAIGYFAALEERLKYEGDKAEEEAAYERALPPPPPPPPPPEPRRLSGWKLSKALDKRGMLDPLVDFLKTDNYALVAFFRPQYFMEDDSDFIRISLVMREKFGIEEKVWKEIVEESVDVEGKEA